MASFSSNGRSTMFSMQDDISGAISHERFLKLSADYETEQKELTEQVKAWRQAVEKFVKKIIVHAPDKSSGHRRQKIELIWNFIGEVTLPGDDQTVERQRKGRTA